MGCLTKARRKTRSSAGLGDALEVVLRRSALEAILRRRVLVDVALEAVLRRALGERRTLGLSRRLPMQRRMLPHAPDWVPRMLLADATRGERCLAPAMIYPI